MNTLKEITKGFLRLIYPDDCPGCRMPASPGSIFCPQCAYHLKTNDMHLYRDNLFTLHFRGRFPFVTGTSMFIYKKGGRVKTLIQSIKYNGFKHTAMQIGEWYGETLRDTSLYSNIDCIIPVPIHPSKKRVRGYNQSAWFAKGLAKRMDASLNFTAVIKREKGESQTRYNRWERAQNLQNAFLLKSPQEVRDKHLLLVDDVLTTGATFEALAQSILPGHPASIRFCTIAMGMG